MAQTMEENEVRASQFSFVNSIYMSSFEDLKLSSFQNVRVFRKRPFNGACFPAIERESSGAYEGLI
jgi:hypothetical protein